MYLRPILAICVTTAAMLAAVVPAHAQSPYAGQETRAIKALSPEDIRSYENGKGMGFAKAAELNGYPGPSHVLELASALELSSEQRRATEALFQQMEGKASALGRRLIDEERKLDVQFAARTVTPQTLAVSIQRIGDLYAQVRLAHLETHLEQVALLSPAQIARYGELRGYSAAAGTKAHTGHH